MQCQVCYSKRKTKFNTGRNNICQWCINLLVNTPVDPKILINSLTEVIQRNLDTPTKFKIKAEIEKKYSSQTGFFKTQLKKIFDSSVYHSEINSATEREYHRSLDRYEEEKQIRFNELIRGKYVPKIKYNFFNPYHGFYGSSEKDDLQSWEKDFLKYYRAFLLRIISQDGNKEKRFSEYRSKEIKKEVINQDGNFCNACGIRGANVELHLHHIIPIDQYGTNHLNNLVILCQRCHQNQHSLFKINRHKESELNLKKFVAIDTETTGLSAVKHKIIEIAAVKFNSGKVIDTFSTLIDPRSRIPSKITDITGITTIMVQGKPAFPEIKDQFLQFIGNEVLVFHNAPFDLKFLKKNGVLIENEYFDTLKLARDKYPRLSNYKLQTLIRALNIDVDKKHRALSDATAAGYIFINISKG
jgi:DNA polymerase III epsilon subunit family exonuclease